MDTLSVPLEEPLRGGMGRSRSISSLSSTSYQGSRLFNNRDAEVALLKPKWPRRNKVWVSVLFMGGLCDIMYGIIGRQTGRLGLEAHWFAIAGGSMAVLTSAAGFAAACSFRPKWSKVYSMLQAVVALFLLTANLVYLILFFTRDQDRIWNNCRNVEHLNVQDCQSAITFVMFLLIIAFTLNATCCCGFFICSRMQYSELQNLERKGIIMHHGNPFQWIPKLDDNGNIRLDDGAVN